MSDITWELLKLIMKCTSWLQNLSALLKKNKIIGKINLVTMRVLPQSPIPWRQSLKGFPSLIYSNRLANHLLCTELILNLNGVIGVNPLLITQKTAVTPVLLHAIIVANMGIMFINAERGNLITNLLNQTKNLNERYQMQGRKLLWSCPWPGMILIWMTWMIK